MKVAIIGAGYTGMCIAKKLAEFKGIEEEKMAKITYENAMKLFFGKEERNA